MERITKWLDKLSDMGIEKVAIAATQLAETPPVLRQLNWQDQVKAGTGEAWLPSGEIIHSEGWMPPIVGMDISGKKVAEQDPRFLCLWFSHPLIDKHSVSSVRLFQEDGKLPLDVPSSDRATSPTPRSDNSGNTGWITATLCAGYIE